MRKLPLDRITMIEQARLHRDVHYGAARLSEAVGPADSRLPAESTGPDFTDTVKFKSPVIQLSAERRESERLLPPGASGPNGAAYKLLRTQVLKRLDKLNANTLAVMSAGAADGKTLTAINLAICIAAQQDRTALLVDLDLRNPNVHRRFGFEPTVGIEECIESRRPVQDAMVKIAGYDTLTILPARERVQHSSELLSAHRTAEMMQEMRTRYANRILIFDLPPVLLADDALAFSRIVQAGLIVVGEGRTKRGDVTRSIRLLNDLPIVGTVLNGSRDAVNVYY
jgi:protein-tyrosine kinase